MVVVQKYSAILDINPSKYEEVKQDLDYRTLNYNPIITMSSLQEMDIKEQLKYYVEKNTTYNIKDRDRMFDLIDML